MQVLLVDDDDVAVESVVRGMKKHDVAFPIIVAEDGLVALDIMRGTHPIKQLTQPYVVLLDLNMPNMDGFEFLQVIRNDELLKATIVFVLTTSGSDADMFKAYNEHIAGYMVKSCVGPQFSKLFKLLEDYARTVKLP